MSDIVSCTVPISGSNQTLYFKDAALRADIANVGDYIGYYPSKGIIGLQADFENGTFTRLGEAEGLSAGSDFNKFQMYGGRRLCNLADDGTVNAWYGEAGYTEDGSNGQVMVWQPKFYYKVVPLKIEEIESDGYSEPEGYHLLKANYLISDICGTGFKLHPAFIGPNGEELKGIYISAYEGSIFDTSENKYLVYDDNDYVDNVYTSGVYIMDATEDKFCSIAGVKPASGNVNNLTKSNIESMCQNRGSTWHSENLQVLSMEQLLHVIEYASFNSQNNIGSGVVGINDSNGNNSVNTGSTSSFGNNSGRATSSYQVMYNGNTHTLTDNNKTSIRYRGRENDWGNMWSFVNGVIVYGNRKQIGGIIYYCIDYNYTDSTITSGYVSTDITLVANNGMQDTMYFGYSNTFDWGFIPTQKGGAFIGDSAITRNGLDYYACMTTGGAFWETVYAGIFDFNSYSTYSDKNLGTGGRIMCLGPTSNN